MILQKISTARAKEIRREAPLWVGDRESSRLSHQMGYPAVWNVPDSPTCLMCVKAEVDVLIMRVISLIQYSNVLKHLTTDDHGGTANPVYLASMVWHR